MKETEVIVTPPPRDPTRKANVAVVTPYSKTMLAAAKRAEAAKKTKASKATKDPRINLFHVTA